MIVFGLKQNHLSLIDEKRAKQFSDFIAWQQIMTTA